MPVVKITADKPVRYSINNSSLMEYAPGEFYAVPDFVATGMTKRGWAKLATAEETAAAEAAAQQATNDPHQTPGDIDDQERIEKERLAKIDAEEKEKADAEAKARADEEKAATKAKEKAEREKAAEEARAAKAKKEK